MSSNENVRAAFYSLVACVFSTPAAAQAEVVDDAFKSLGPFPIVQAVAGAILIAAAVYVIVKAKNEREDKPMPNSGNQYPQWVLAGPMHDSLTEIYRLSEQSRVSNELMREMLHEIRESSKEQRMQTQLLEDMRNTVILYGGGPGSNPAPRRHPR